MTIEEKAKAYDEALEKARKHYNSKYHPSEGPSGVYLNNADLEEIFPVLKESEDERIRKSIIRLLQVGGYMPLEDKEKAFAYLEKQKINTEGDFGRGYDCGYKACLNNHGAEWFEKQKEQKLEYLDLDNASQDYVYNNFCPGADFTPDYIKGLMEDAFIDGANWQKEQKPLSTEETELNSIAFLEQMGYTCIPPETKIAEWSEDDKTRLKVIKEELERFIMFNQYGTSLSVDDINWLKSLPERFNLQPKQEWNEEDEYLLIETIQHLEELIRIDEKKHCGVNVQYYQRDIDWLKSLRPSWKPEGQQLDCLRHMINVSTVDKIDKQFVIDLYEQLKKL